MSGEPAPVGARALFAAALLGLGLASVFALERVGVPAPLVAALAPLLGLVGVVAVGVLTRARTLLDFLAARRAAPAAFAGLALAATVGGFALGLAGADDATNTPWRGFAVGVVLAALVFAPQWRAAHASSMADVFATRFSAPFARVGLSIVLVASGLSLAAAGLGFAGLTFQATFHLSRGAALALGAVVLFLTLAPGGLRSLVWCDAATAGAGLIALALLSALSFDGDFNNLAETWSALGQPSAPPFVEEAAVAAATAAMFAFGQPAFAVASPGAARRAGVAALLWLTLGAFVAAVLGDISLAQPSHAGLAALLAGLPALSLARAGLHAASRPAGFDFARLNSRLWVLASRRMAVVRAATALGALAAAWLAKASPHPYALFQFALSLWLAFGAPSALLALLPGRHSGPAIAALAASLAAAVVGRVAGFGAAGSDLLVGALGAGAAGLAAGVFVFTFSRQEDMTPARDPFVDLPGEPLV
jgi:xanthosine utilization system XapX-like protein